MGDGHFGPEGRGGSTTIEGIKKGDPQLVRTGRGTVFLFKREGARSGNRGTRWGEGGRTVNNISELLGCRNYRMAILFDRSFSSFFPKPVDPYAPQATDGDARRPFSNIANVRRPRPLPSTVGAMEDFTLLCICIISILYYKYIVIMYYITNPLPNIYTLYY